MQSSVAAVKRGPSRGPEQALLRLSFNSHEGDLPFHVAVRGNRKAVPAGAMTHSAARVAGTMTMAMAAAGAAIVCLQRC